MRGPWVLLMCVSTLSVWLGLVFHSGNLDHSEIVWGVHFNTPSPPVLSLGHSTSRIRKVALPPGKRPIFPGPSLCSSKSGLGKLGLPLFPGAEETQLSPQWASVPCILEKLLLIWSQDDSSTFSLAFWSTGRISGNSLNSQLRFLKNLFLWVW